MIYDMLTTSRTVVICFLKADATVEGITITITVALSSDELIILTDRQGNEILGSEGTRSKLHDQKLLFNL